MGPNATPTEDSLYQAALNNSDGFGYAIVIGDNIHMHRGMSATKVIDSFLTMRRAHPEGCAIWHARFATHGSRSKDNCHPFRVGDSGMTFMAHNGILPFQPDAGDKHSDTRLFADEILPGLVAVGALDSQRGLRSIEAMIGTDKMAVLTVDPAMADNLYILNDHKGHWAPKDAEDAGVWYSNYSYMTRSTYQSADGTTWTSKNGVIVPFDGPKVSQLTEQEQADIDEWWARHAACVLCQNAMDELDDVCPFCDTCRWCEGDVKECTCSHSQDLSDDLAEFARGYAEESAIDPDERDRAAMQAMFADYE